MYNCITKKIQKGKSMDPLQITNNVSNINIINTDKSINSLKDIDTDKFSSQSTLNTTVTTTDQSKFSVSITNSINKISNLENIKLNIDTQINIIDEINLNIKNSTSVEQLNNIQPTVKDLMNSFNSSDLNKLISEQSTEGSDSYFDGKLGSKPLSPSDIMDATQEKISLLNSMKATNTKSIDESINQTQHTIKIEKESTLEDSPYKEINFKKESIDFSSSNISDIGSIKSAHINPSSSNTLRLLT